MTDSTPATAAHQWQPPYSAASVLCGATVMRDGGGDECGLPQDHPVHSEALVPCSRCGGDWLGHEHPEGAQDAIC